jgi:hypothetical protein
MNKASYNLSIIMNKPPYLQTTRTRSFWQTFLIILGIDTLIVFAAVLFFHDLGQISNFYFLSSLILFIIAAIPIFSEVGATAKIAGKSLRSGEEAGPQLKQKKPVFDRGARTTYIYGLAGIITFILSMLTSGIY